MPGLPLMQRLKPITFWPALVGVALVLVLIAADQQRFVELVSAVNAAIIHHLSGPFLYCAVLMLALCLLVFIAPLGAVRIGGEHAVPIYSPFRWFAVSLTTVIAMGILFWAVAEPVVHFHEPPPFSGVEPGGRDAKRFAMSTVFVHWTLVPYAIYTVTALTFALSFYNRGERFSVAALLRPLLGNLLGQRAAHCVDALVLFSVIVGMSAVLSAGLLLITDGFHSLLALPPTPLMLGLCALSIVGIALASAASGLRRGIQVLARINTVLFVLLLVYVFLVGPTLAIIKLGGSGTAEYFLHFWEHQLVLNEPSDSDWSGWWTTAFYASWFAWAPLASMFLGKIARGYTVRQFILVNLLLPSLFGGIWFAVFGGAAIHYDEMNQSAMFATYENHGLAAMAYQLFSYLPGSTLLSLFFIFACFISFITSTDSNTDVIAALCVRSVTADHQESPFVVKLLWASVVGVIGWCSATYLGSDGIKMLANLAGLPGLLIVLGSAASLLVLLGRVSRLGLR